MAPKQATFLILVLAVAITVVITLLICATNNHEEERQEILDGPPTHIGNVTAIDHFGDKYATRTTITLDNETVIVVEGTITDLKIGHRYELWVWKEVPDNRNRQNELLRHREITESEELK